MVLQLSGRGQSVLLGGEGGAWEDGRLHTQSWVLSKVELETQTNTDGSTEKDIQIFIGKGVELDIVIVGLY